MAFKLFNWTCISSAMNEGQLTVTPFGGVPTLINAPNVFVYGDGTDTVATIIAANYFLSLFGQLKVNDIILGHGSDATFAIVVTAVSPTSITVASMGLTTSIGTANIVNGAVTSAKLAVNTLQYAAVTVSSAEFLGMFAAPKLLVAAQGANTMIVLDKLDLLMTFNSAAYAAGGVTAVQYNATANGAGVIASTTLAAATFAVGVSTGFMFNTGVVTQPFTTTVNQGLYLSNITGAFTTGNSPFVAHIWYKVVPTV